MSLDVDCRGVAGTCACACGHERRQPVSRVHGACIKLPPSEKDSAA